MNIRINNIIDYLSKQSVGEPYILTTQTFFISLLVTTLLAGVMLYTYKASNDPLTYNKRFNTTLLMMAYLSTILIALVQNNPIISIGVIGSLSICRIRTNTKDPRDLGFVFWAMAIGISSAVGAFVIGIISTLVLAILLITFSRSIRERNSLLVVVRGETEGFDDVQEAFRDMPKCSLYSKNIFHDSYEIVYDIPAKNNNEQLMLKTLNDLPGVNTVNIIAPETRVL